MEFVGVTTSTKRILDLKMNLTVGELLALALAIEKQLTKAITKDKAIQFWVNTLEFSFIDIQNSNLQYSIGFPKAKIRLENSFKIIAFLDTSAEINIITRKIIEGAGLAIQYGLKLELVSHINYNYFFPSSYKDVEVVIRGFKTKHLIFIIKYRDHDLVLGQLFLNSVKLM